VCSDWLILAGHYSQGLIMGLEKPIKQPNFWSLQENLKPQHCHGNLSMTKARFEIFSLKASLFITQALLA